MTRLAGTPVTRFLLLHTNLLRRAFSGRPLRLEDVVMNANTAERREWAGDDLLYDDNWTLGGDEDAEFGVYGLESLGWSDGGPAAVTDTLDAPTAKSDDAGLVERLRGRVPDYALEPPRLGKYPSRDGLSLDLDSAPTHVWDPITRLGSASPRTTGGLLVAPWDSKFCVAAAPCVDPLPPAWGQAPPATRNDSPRDMQSPRGTTEGMGRGVKRARAPSQKDETPQRPATRRVDLGRAYDAFWQRVFANCTEPLHPPASGAFKGVTVHRRTHLYEGHLWHEGKQLYLGSFPSMAAAVRAHDIMALNCKSADVDAHLQCPRTDYANMEAVARELTQDQAMHTLRKVSRDCKDMYQAVEARRCRSASLCDAASGALVPVCAAVAAAGKPSAGDR